MMKKDEPPRSRQPRSSTSRLPVAQRLLIGTAHLAKLHRREFLDRADNRRAFDVDVPRPFGCTQPLESAAKPDHA